MRRFVGDAGNLGSSGKAGGDDGTERYETQSIGACLMPVVEKVDGVIVGIHTGASHWVSILCSGVLVCPSAPLPLQINQA